MHRDQRAVAEAFSNQRRVQEGIFVVIQKRKARRSSQATRKGVITSEMDVMAPLISCRLDSTLVSSPLKKFFKLFAHEMYCC